MSEVRDQKPDHSRPRSSQWAKAATGVRNVLFVCSGNICRSPLAEGLLKKLLQELPVARVQPGSAGFIALPGNSASFNAMLVAQENGFSLEEHKARALRPKLVARADLILVMEPWQRQELLEHYPQAAGKVLLLRHFARYGPRHRGIMDPYGLSLEAYRFCFQDIKECVESLYRWLRSGAQDP